MRAQNRAIARKQHFARVRVVVNCLNVIDGRKQLRIRLLRA
jgi:hypothetical protein